MTDAERQAALEAIAAEVRACTRCRLHETRTQAVPGEGDPDTEVVFVGEGPGFNEDRRDGRSSAARATCWSSCSASIGWRREEVFITNIVKCRPPDNRDPQPDEIAACAPYLRRQLEVLDPAVVVTLGRHLDGAVHAGRADLPGPRHRSAGRSGDGARDALVFAMYHPAAALRTPAVERESYADIAGVPAALIDARRRREAVRAGLAPGRARDARRGHRPAPLGRALSRRRREPAPCATSPSRRQTPPAVDDPHPQLTSSSHGSERRSTPADDQPLRIIPLGGVGEIGKNMYVFEYRDEIVVIDCGLMFPDEEMFGIDLVIPDITYLKERRAKVKAFLITHAHEDHVGALPYVLPEFPGVPVYASTLARGLLGNKIKEHKLHNNPLIALEPGDEIDIGAFHVMPVPGRPFDPGRDGHRPAHPGRHDRPHRRLQVRPHPGRRQAVRLRDPRQARRRRASPACSPTRPAPRTRATPRPSGPSARPSARSWSRSRAGSSSPPSPATSPASSRSSTPPRT